MYGPGMREAGGPSAELEMRILEENGMTLERLGKAKASGTRRLGRLLVDDLHAEAVEEGVELRFSLPKGAFATNVLREIMK